MKKSLGILIIAALSGVLWAGCGGSDGGGDCVAGKVCLLGEHVRSNLRGGW